MAYFLIMSGLRGCYMPDSSYVTKCDTRRELKSALSEEARHRDDMVGLNKRDIASAAAKAWRERKSKSCYAVALIPYGEKPGNYPYALEVCTATRSDYLEQAND